MDRFSNLILLFYIYSFAGWCMEVVLKYIQFHRFINRGFFAGPICPIYGSGAVLITVAVGSLSSVESAYGTTFAISLVLCGLVEYLTSYFMEKRFHARWWDYSQKPMNLHGRVWIGNLILFGIAGVGIIHLINPALYAVLNPIPLKIRSMTAGALTAVFAADYVVTHFVLKLVKAGIEHSEADNTEEIRQEIHVMMSDKSIFHRRFADAYPEVIYRTERINSRLEAIRAETERLRREAEKRIEANREPAAWIKNTIIAKQDELISLLYDEAQASEEMRALQAEISREKERLDYHPMVRVENRLKEKQASL